MSERTRPAVRTRLRHRLALAFVAFVVTMAAIEGVLCLVHPLPPLPAVRWHRFLPTWCVGAPGRTERIDPGPLAGVTPGLVANAWNELGFLFPIEKARRASRDELRIAAVGGSTTECAVLAAERRWPAVLEDLLRQRTGRPVTVLNLGVSAQDTRTHLQTTSHVVTALDVDVCIYLIGANDLGVATSGGLPMLGEGNLYPLPRVSQSLRGLWRATQIARHLDWLRGEPQARRTTPYFAAAAAFQASLPVFDPPMQTNVEGLANYTRNVVSLAGICAAHAIRPLFVTQPVMFGAQPSVEELAAFWGCHGDGHAYSAANVVALLDAVNGHLVRTCAQRGVACVDAAKSVPKGFASFYDQVHFNEVGARALAQALVDPLVALLQ